MIFDPLMSVGTWDLRFAADTPRPVRDLVVPLSHICVFPERLPNLLPPDSVLDDAASAAVLGLARYVGVVTRPGPFYSIGGHGLGWWLGTGDRYFYVGGGSPGTTLPRLYMSAVTRDLEDYVSIAADSTGLSLGTVSGPTSTVGSTVSMQWMSKREVLDMACRHYDVEWKITTTGAVHAGPYTALWDSTPAVVVSRYEAGRKIGYTGLRADVDASVDYWSMADQVWLLGKDGFGSYAGASQYKGFSGWDAYAEMVVEGVDTLRSQEDTMASAYHQRWSQPQRELRLSTDEYDLSGTLEVGAPMYLYDPDLGLEDLLAGPQIEWEGQTIQPLTVRCVSQRWPVRDGMGVYLRISQAPAEFRYIDLTDYIVPETGAIEIQTAANAPMLWWDRWLGVKQGIR